MRRREYLTAAAIAASGCLGGGERDKTTQTEAEATESDSNTAEKTATDTGGDSSDSGADANWIEFDGLTNLIAGLREGDYLAIVPGEMRPDYGLEQDPYTWWQINYDLSSHELDRQTIDDVGALENDPGEVQKGGTTEIKGVDLHYIGDKHNYPADEGWNSLSGAENVYSERALGIVRAAQRGDSVEVINQDSGDVVGEMFSEGQPDAIWVASEDNKRYEGTSTRFGAIYDKEEGATYSEKSGIRKPKYKDGAITKGISDVETISQGEGASWEEILEHMVRDP
jgi:hypothetical protein